MYYDGKPAKTSPAGCFCNLFDCEHRRHAAEPGFLSEAEAAALEQRVLSTFERLLQEREHAIARAIRGWAEQAGVTPEVWLQTYACHVEDIYEANVVTFRVHPVLRSQGVIVLRGPDDRVLPR